MKSNVEKSTENTGTENRVIFVLGANYGCGHHSS